MYVFAYKAASTGSDQQLRYLKRDQMWPPSPSGLHYDNKLASLEATLLRNYDLK